MPAPRPNLILPLIFWLLLQLAALAIGAGGVPLSANAPRPPETLAVHVMLVTQFAGAAALWPLLFRDWRSALAVIATTLPFLQAAGFLSATPIPRLLAAGGLLLMWLASLGALPTCDRDGATRRIAHAVVMLVSIGAGLLTYLQAEFSPAGASAYTGGPIVWAVDIISGKSAGFPWICVGVILIVCALARFIGKRALCEQTSSPGSPAKSEPAH